MKNIPIWYVWNPEDECIASDQDEGLAIYDDKESADLAISFWLNPGHPHPRSYELRRTIITIT